LIVYYLVYIVKFLTQIRNIQKRLLQSKDIVTNTYYIIPITKKMLKK